MQILQVLLQLLLLVVGFVMLVKGADWFVDGASKVAEIFGIPQLVIGLTIVAMGTSLPEAAVSTSAALKGSAEITIGNVVGSNIMNILLILGITSVISPLAVQLSTIKYEIPMVIGASVLLAGLGLLDTTVGRIDGIILLLGMVLYLAYLFKMAKKGQAEALEKEEAAEDGNNSGKKDSIIKQVLLILVGASLIVLGSNVTVDAATELALIFGMEERIIGLTIVAFGTSLPELVTSATAAIKGKADIAVGNIVGSNLFNLLFVVGIAAVITPVIYEQKFLVDTIVCIASAILLWLCVIRTKKLKRSGGAILLLCYAAYFVYLMISPFPLP
ncbi:MAG: calcium/sodium antiporter [Lachnospiraceae bacterium]|nr:calcium/sodium antiporter [Lachnospiraceae bacterium]